MAEYIEREEAVCIALGAAALGNTAFADRFEIAARLRAIPAADVRPVVKGFNKLKDYPTLFECSACGWECDDTMPGDTATYNFCPNCGAEMEES